MKKNTEWMSISDIMSGLMMVFLFITVTLLVSHDEEEKQRTEELMKLRDLQDDSLTKEELLNIIAKLRYEINELKIEIGGLNSKNKQLRIDKNKFKKEVFELKEEVRLLKIDIAKLKKKIPNKANIDSIIAEINSNLRSEFDKDLEKWGASFGSNNSIIFNHPDIYFDSDSHDITDRYKSILSEFFPRYIKVFANSSFEPYIKNIKIEGHTPKRWNWNASTDGKRREFFNLMGLSQKRANSVLEYCYLSLPKYDYFLKSKLESSGLSFSQALTIENTNDTDNMHKVTFRLIFNE